MYYFYQISLPTEPLVFNFMFILKYMIVVSVLGVHFIFLSPKGFLLKVVKFFNSISRAGINKEINIV